MVGRVQGSLQLHPASSLPHYFLHTPKRWGKFSAIAKIFLKAPTSYFSSFILPLSQHHIHHLRVYHEPFAFVWTLLQYPKKYLRRQLPSCFFSFHNILLTFFSCYPQLNNIRNQLGTLWEINRAKRPCTVYKSSSQGG